MSADTPAPRIAPLEPPFEPALAEELAKWMPPGAEGPPLALFRTLAVHPELFSRMRPLGAGILGHGKVAPRLREVMIDRTSARCGAVYEWGVHAAAFGAAVGLTEDQLRSTATGGPDDPVWDPEARAVMALADELSETSTVSEATFAALREHFSDEQIVELVVTCGWYHLIAFVIAAARVPLEPWAAPFPAA